MADTERPLIFRADGKVVEGAPPMLWDGVFGLLKEDLQDQRARGQLTAMAQLFELVAPGLILTRHIFRGLQRPLYCDDDPQGDERKLIYTRRPSADYEWIGGPQGTTVRRPAPAGHVFVVIISPNLRHREQYANVDGWIERWNWVKEDNGLAEAPVQWVDRYRQKLWSRE